MVMLKRHLIYKQAVDDYANSMQKLADRAHKMMAEDHPDGYAEPDGTHTPTQIQYICTQNIQYACSICKTLETFTLPRVYSLSFRISQSDESVFDSVTLSNIERK